MSSSSPDLRSRAGFTLIEIFIVVVIVGLLVQIALPRYHELRRQAVAGKAAADYHAVKLAAYAYHTEFQTWPAEVASTVVPAELVPDLPEGFDFNRGEYTLDWQNWALPNGLPANPQQGMLMALSISTTDALLANIIRIKLGSRTVHFTSGNTTTFLVLEQ
jgi:prepilin-type N-terminal cleavage/methylation domain-containing protein